MTDIAIVALAERPALAAICGGWEHQEWGMASGRPLAAEVAKFTDARRDAIPLTLVAVTADGQAAGMVSLWAQDCPLRPDLTPWVASLYVPPAMRGRGIGRRLFDQIQAVAADLGLRRLYLMTQHSVDYYAALGWRGFAHIDGPGAMRDAVLMTRDLDAAPGAAIISG